jgi:hypothetical protein
VNLLEDILLGRASQTVPESHLFTLFTVLDDIGGLDAKSRLVTKHPTELAPYLEASNP